MSILHKYSLRRMFFAVVLPLAASLSIIGPHHVAAQAAVSAEQLVAQVRSRLDKVNDYEATGKMKTNVVFIKAPIAQVKVYFKKPDKLKVKNENGISFIPKGSVNINMGSLFINNNEFDILDGGTETGTGLRIIKLLPNGDNTDIVLSTLYIDQAAQVIKKAKTTTRENGTYELEMQYGKYVAYGLADKVIFSFNTKDYKLPKGVTLDYDDGSGKAPPQAAVKNRKGRVEITYTNYQVNKGVPDSIFQ